MKKIIHFLFLILLVNQVHAQFINVSGVNTTGRFGTCAQQVPALGVTAELINLNGGAVVNNGVFTCNNGCDSSTVRVTISNIRWNQAPNAEWLHGLFLPANAGFVVSAVAIPAGFITYNPGCVGMCPSGSGFNGGPGFYFDNTAANTCCGIIAANDGLPCNNYGDVTLGCNNLFNLIFDIKFCNSIITNNSYTFTLHGSSDGETGCWNFNDLLPHNIQFTIATNPCLPTVISPTATAPVRVCVGGNVNYTATLTGTCNNNTISWWDDPIAGNLVGTGSPFIYDPAGATCPGGVTLYATCCTGNIAGCINREPITIPGTCDMITITNVTVTNATCLVPGGITATTVANAIGAVNYNLNPGAVNNATGVFTGLTQAQYTLTVTDATGCTASSIVNIVIPPPIVFAPPVITGTTCALPNSGQLVIAASGGTGAIVLTINPLAAQAPPGTFTGLSAQSYTITATDALNCTATTIVVIPNSPPVNWVSVNATDVLCNGANDGTINALANGGIAPILYTLQPGGANNNTGIFTGLAPNTYTVNAVDANGCSTTTVVVIANPTVLSWSNVTFVNVLCANGNNGSISALVTGGTPSYQYQLMPGNITNGTGNFTLLQLGTYTITATDMNGCSVTSTVTITQPPVLNYITSTSTAAICNGANTGSITVAAIGGNGLLTYTLNPGNVVNNTGLFPNLAAGIYTVTTTDANNCTLTTTINVTQPIPITFPSVITGSPTCIGLSNGSLSVVAAGGVGTITYTLNPLGTVNITGNFSGLAASTYTVNATDINGCSASTVVVIAPPPAITFPVALATPALCNGALNGTITVNAAGGAGGFTYLLQPGGILNNTGLFTGLGVGIYTITAIDANNCSNTTNVTILQPTSLSWNTVTTINVTCNGANNGSINANAIGGINPINYTLNPLGINNATGIFNNLPGNIYTLTATDANGCTISSIVNIIDPGALTITSVNIVPPNCIPGNNGVVTVNISGGTPVYNYNIGAGNQLSNTFTNLGQGTYTIVVTDANGCSATSVINVINPNSPLFTNVNVQNVNCAGGGNGSIIATATGGNGQITYTLQPGNVITQTGVYPNLQAGTYTITATDVNNCSTQTIVTITAPILIIIDSVLHQDIICNNGNTGTINAYASGGVGVLTYNLQPGNITNQTGAFTNLADGTYIITITDANGCFVQTSVTILLLPIMQWDSVSYSTLFCAGGNNGYIYATVIGGVAPIEYNLQPGNITNLTGYFTNLVAGVYVVTATDANGCTTDISINLSQPSPVVITNVVNTIISCIPGNDGTITITATGGTQPYTYTKGAVTQAGNVFTGVGPGIYLITVTDVNGCTASVFDTLFSPIPPVISAAVSTQALCNGDANGTINVTATGGLGILNYTLLPNNITNTTGIFNNLIGGTYTITVTDILNCTTNVIVNVVNPAPVTFSNVSIVEPLCTGDSNGTINVTATGGTGVYTYVLNPGAVTNNTGIFPNLGIGTYTITVTDINNCSTSTTVVMTQPNPMAWTVNTFVSPTCNGVIDGSIQVTATGGVGIINYLLLPNGTVNNTGFFNNINAGIYTVNATDANGCSISTTINVTQPPALTITNITSTPPSCIPGNDGTVTITVSGGTSPYNYNIGAGNQLSNIFTLLAGGTYTITVTDANNCTLTNVVSLTNPGAPTVSNVTPTNATCNGSNDGGITITTIGGTPPITYTLLPGGAFNNTGIFTGLGPNIYTINVSDANGCTTVATATITAPASILFTSLVNTSVSCFGGNDGTIVANVNGGIGVITYILLPVNVTNITGVFSNLTAGIYTITATDVNGCSTSSTTTIIEPAQLVWGNVVIGNVSCNNGNDGNIAVTTSGGTGIITYTLLPVNISNTSGTFSNLTFGTYTVQAVDANGCSISTIVDVLQSTPIVITSIVSTVPTCVPGNDATITMTANGGLLPYNYNIGFGNQLSNVFTNAGAGNYTVTITDANGCTATSAFAVTNPASPAFTNATVTNILCNGGNNGAITVTAAGGIGALNYTLLPNNINNATGIFNALTAGVYTVNVTDASNCSASTLITITEPNALAVSNLVTNNILCFGAANGDVTITTLGGTGLVDFTLQPNNITNQTGYFNNLAGGTYTINCIDANGCTLTTTFVILEPTALVYGIPIINNVLCNNGNDGNVSITATGGTGNITYTLQPVGLVNNTGFFNSLAIGNYTIVATDANGCTLTTTFTITQPPPTQLVNYTTITPSCIPGNDGSITVNIVGGLPPYQYSINGGAPQINNVFTNLAAGTYTILVADVNDCKVIIVVTLANSMAPVITNVAITPVNCFGGSDGDINITATGGNGIINYTLLPNNITNTTGIFPTLLAGTYTINVVDANGCSVSTIVVVNSPTQMILSNLVNTNVSCFGGTNATITALVTGGTGAINYNLQPGNLNNATGLFTNLNANTYTLTATDANGCTLTTLVNITQPTQVVWSSTAIVDVSCNGGNDGTITVLATGGTGIMDYNIQPGNITNQTGLFVNLTAGIYTIIAADVLGCSITTTLTVNQPTPVVVANVTNTTPSCVPGNDGTITIVAGGGTPAYTYNIGGANQAANVFTNIGIGTYTITITDANGCTGSSIYNVTAPNAPSFTNAVNTPVSCNGGNDGTLTVTATGGAGGINYTLLPNNIINATGIFTGLTAGVYTIQAIDASNCSVSTTVQITEPVVLTWTTLTTTDVSCFGGNDGSITTLVNGGVGAINYNLQIGNINNATGLFTNLAIGIYTLTATDANGCTIQTTVAINQPTQLTWTATANTNVSCNAGNDATITVVASGGTGLINYTLQPNNITNASGLFNTLIAGAYTVYATDANGCSISTIINITEPTPLLITNVTNTTPSCVPGNDGSITITAGGGTPVYNYNIGGANQLSNVFANVGIGNYTLTVSDANGCTVTSVYNVTAPNAPTITNVVLTNASCVPGGDATATITAIGGNGAYTYSSDGINFQASNVLTGLSNAMYTIIVADAFGCTASSVIQINNAPSPVINNVVTTLASCVPGCDATATITAAAGLPGYTYSLDGINFQVSNVFAGLCTATYTATVKDANGCTSTSVFNISTSNGPVITNTTFVNILCNGGNNGNITVTTTGGTGTINYTLQPNNITNITGVFNNLLAGVYTVFIVDANGCGLNTVVTITEPAPLQFANIVANGALCNGAQNGTIDVTTTGGTGAITYTINPFANFVPPATFNNLTGNTTYTITATDANGCSITTAVFVFQPPALTIDSAFFSNITCFNANDGSINIYVSGGTGVLNYNLAPLNINNLTGAFTGLAPNVYTVTVTDANNCTLSTTFNITQPLPITLVSIAATNVSCNNAQNATISIACTGGTGILNYNLQPTNTNNTTGLFTNLGGGTYTITVTDANNCTYTTSIAVVNPPILSFGTFIVTDISCFGNNDGIINATAIGGTGTLVYTLQPGNVINGTGLFTALLPGTYTVSVSDANLCSTSSVAVIVEPLPLTATLDSTQNVICHGGNNGFIIISANGGITPYTFTLNPTGVINNTGDFQNVFAGTYTVVVTDANGCTTEVSNIIITEPPAIVFTTLSHVDVICYGDSTGSITVQASGGTGNIVYSIAPALGTQSPLGFFAYLPSLVYTVSATDANNCTLTTLVDVKQNNQILITEVTYREPICYGDANGMINFIGVGGVPPLTYHLDNSTGQSTGYFNNIIGGYHLLTITDSMGCRRDSLFLLPQPEPVHAGSLTITSESCKGAKDGKIVIVGAGGRGGYTYYIRPGLHVNKNGLFYGFEEGVYTITIKDTSLCEWDTIINVPPPTNPLNLFITKQDLGCYGTGDEGWAQANVSGGASPYTYQWSTTPTQVTDRATNLFFGYYFIEVIDANGCKISDTVYIEPGPCCDEVFIPNAFTPNGDGNNDVFRVTTATGVELLQFDVYDRWGVRVWGTTDFRTGWDGTYTTGRDANVNTFYYIFRYRCMKDGQNYIKKGDINLIR
ncbi:MAG: gliding motility-associated C-terminal domain-containing protein [Bacteroidetes bacterium]|nr:gliding motility-associated C-terminal domain-containing protein [Bacteroidota bacterium]